MKAYKGFNKDMTCRGFQFKEGETYEEDKAKLCKSGFHACEAPLDTFGYYDPGTSVYHACDLEDVSNDRSDEDSKIVGKRIKIGARLTIRDLVNAQVEFVKEHCTNENNAIPGKSATAGEYGAATAGNRGAATAGNRGAATAGYAGAATAGNRGAATAGEYGAATSKGFASVGKNGIACVRGCGCKVLGGIGAVLVIAEENDSNYDIKAWKAVVVDGETVKADTWYTLCDGKLVEVVDEG